MWNVGLASILSQWVYQQVLFLLHLTYLQENLFALEQSAGSHPTLIDDKFITLSRGKTHKSPEWQNWLLNSGIEIIGRRQVSLNMYSLYAHTHPSSQASNGVMYLIQGTISVE